MWRWGWEESGGERSGGLSALVCAWRGVREVAWLQASAPFPDWHVLPRVELMINEGEIYRTGFDCMIIAGNKGVVFFFVFFSVVVLCV